MYPIKTKAKYDPENLAATAATYTTVYLGNYESGDFDEDVGSHCGVDIIPVVPNDTVSSVLDGTVIVAAMKGMDGNCVVIRHDHAPDPSDLTKTTTLFSSYLHLSSYSVAAGDVVKEGAPIGRTGNTGNSTGEHLHFQIECANVPFHPYWPFSMGDAQEAGLGFMEAVNRGLGIENARKYTVNPLTYLDRVASAPNKPVNAPAVSVNTQTVQTVTQTNTVRVATEVSSSTTVSFSDVSASHAYSDAIAFIKARGIATGSNGMFHPDSAVTRAEILKMAFIASGKSLSTDANSHFSDVAVGAWYLPYVNTARELSAVSGYSDGTFHPDSAVTRVESLKIVLGILSVVPDSVSFGVFDDVDASAWFAPYAAWAKASGIFSETSSLHPDAPATRAEVAAIICAALS